MEVVWNDFKKQNLLKQTPCMIWLTGLSGSGKSTIASKLNEKLASLGKIAYILDGDNIRHGLNSDLGFSEKDREENIRRLSEVGKLFVDAGLITISSFISPFKKDRDLARSKIKRFYEVYVKCDISECEKRDPKGMYKKARAGEIKNFTGIDQEYEEPENPEITVDTSKLTVEESVGLIYNYLKKNKII